MASLRKREKRYYIVFNHRDESGKLHQKVYSLYTTSKREAEKMKVEYAEQYRRGEIDPWGDWTPKKAIEKKRRGGKKKRNACFLPRAVSGGPLTYQERDARGIRGSA